MCAPGSAIVAKGATDGEVPADLLLGYAVRWCWRWGRRVVIDDRGRTWSDVEVTPPECFRVVQAVYRCVRYPAVRPMSETSDVAVEPMDRDDRQPGPARTALTRVARLAGVEQGEGALPARPWNAPNHAES